MSVPGPAARAAAVLILLALCVLPSLRDARAEEAESVHAREAARSGRFVGLSSILDWMESHYRGRLLEAELDDDQDEVPVYELDWLTPAGDVLELEFDARTGALLEIEGRGAEAARKP